jgi:hypothetical protein
VSLSSGTALNLDLVAYMAVLPGAADRRKKMRVVFGFAGPGVAAKSLSRKRENPPGAGRSRLSRQPNHAWNPLRRFWLAAAGLVAGLWF